LTDDSGNVTDTFTWDAWGNLLGRTGTTPCNYGLHGEYIDPATNLIYLRARWYNPEIGRFMSMDEWEGVNEEPASLHKYVFVKDNPVNMTDPSGNFSIMEAGISIGIVGILSTMPVNLWAGNSKEDKIKELIQYFYDASKETGIDIDVLGSLAWSESANYALGYWDSKAKPDVGIMQINAEVWPKYADMEDRKNILNGAKILRTYCIPVANKVKARGYFSQPKYIELTPDEKKDNWQVAVWIYKGLDQPEKKRKLAEQWKELIYGLWPEAKYPYETSLILRHLWKQKDTYIIK